MEENRMFIVKRKNILKKELSEIIKIDLITKELKKEVNIKSNIIMDTLIWFRDWNMMDGSVLFIKGLMGNVNDDLSVYEILEKIPLNINTKYMKNTPILNMFIYSLEHLIITTTFRDENSKKILIDLTPFVMSLSEKYMYPKATLRMISSVSSFLIHQCDNNMFMSVIEKSTRGSLMFLARFSDVLGFDYISLEGISGCFDIQSEDIVKKICDISVILTMRNTGYKNTAIKTIENLSRNVDCSVYKKELSKMDSNDTKSKV
eukprot:GHVP01011949.1.p1 GENE.GHVP01011949.1~~GHVP01011949.1.p1  ORF type:complete len:261 (+),score=33.22 GHVP01011949.1:1499-2281(+)